MGGSQTTDAEFRSVIERLPGVAYVEGEHGPLSSFYISPRIEEILGYPADELHEQARWFELMHPDDRDRVLSRDREAREDHLAYVNEYRIRSRDGRWIWFRDEAMFAQDPDGAGGDWYGVMIDVTAQKEAESAVVDLQERYKSLVDNVPAVTYVRSLEAPSTLLFISPQVEDILGIPAIEFRELDLWEPCIHPDDRQEARRATREGLKRDGSIDLQYRMTTRPGDTIWIRDQASTILGADGQPTYVQGFFTDVTEQRRVNQELEETVAKFQTLVEQIPAVTYIEQLGGEIQPLYMSPRYVALTGYTAEERLADPGLFERILHPEDRDRIMAISTQIQNTDGGWSLDYRLLHREGHVVWVQDEATLVLDRQGEPIFWLGLLHDITERKVQEQALQAAIEGMRKADETKDTFLSAVSHDLRSPLTAILGSAVTLEHEEELGIDAEKRRELIAAVARRARHLTGLVDDLLDLERLTQGSLQPRLSPVDIATLVKTVVERSDAAETRGIEIDLNPAPIATDQTMVERIVDNLLGNAVKHTSGGSTIWVSVQASTDGVTISVEDDGPGVPQAIRDTVFERFTRGADTTAPGVGLGLSLVARFTAELGGRAWVEEGLRGGANFRVFLPYQPTAP